ncbi:MAG: hypothetical protein HKN27_07415 [Silicimonas sp.]|nr:hypothetical protein [Silicimonas sp.]
MKRLIAVAVIALTTGYGYEEYTGRSIGIGTVFELTTGAIGGGFAGGYGMAIDAGNSIGDSVGGLANGVSNSMGAALGN